MDSQLGLSKRIQTGVPTMIAKSLTAAALVAGSALAFTADASAKTNWDIHIGLGNLFPAYPVYEEPIYVEPAPIYVAPHYSYELRFSHEPRRHVRRQVRRYNDHDYSARLSCRGGKNVLRDAGFRDVEAYDCSAPTFGYSAWKHGDLFKVRVTSSGDIVSVRQID
jgi:hypothetical protein